MHTEFVRTKILLEKGDVGEAASQIGRLVACEGFDPTILQVWLLVDYDLATNCLFLLANL